jgi:hypothetical protein
MFPPIFPPMFPPVFPPNPEKFMFAVGFVELRVEECEMICDD